MPKSGCWIQSRHYTWDEAYQLYREEYQEQGKEVPLDFNEWRRLKEMEGVDDD